MGPDAERVLIGEVVIEANEAEVKKEPTPRFPPKPMQVKIALDKALLDAGVQFLYSCAATDVLRDANGNVAGIVMVNRSGRQAVIGKVVIDAMMRSDAARIAGAEFRPYPFGPQTFKRIVIGGEIRTDEGLRSQNLPSPAPIDRGGRLAHFTATEYTLTIPMKDASFASFANAEQIARDRTWQKGQADSSETLFQIPPDPMFGKKSLTGPWPGADKIDLDVFRAKGQDRLYALNGCADISREAAARLLRPFNFIKVGTRIGQAAANDAKRAPKPTGVHVPGKREKAIAEGDTSELLIGLRPTQEDPPTVPSGERSVPVIGIYDVVVIGGGTGGAPAGIGAAETRR